MRSVGTLLRRTAAHPATVLEENPGTQGRHEPKNQSTGGEQAQAENHLQPAPEIAGCLSHYSALSRAALEHSALVN